MMYNIYTHIHIYMVYMYVLYKYIDVIYNFINNALYIYILTLKFERFFIAQHTWQVDTYYNPIK